MNKKVNTVIMALLILSASAFGTLMFNEDFDYPIGDSLTLHGFLEYSTGENPISVCAPGLTYTGYLNSGIGNAALVDTSGQDIKRNYQLPSQDSGTVYVSFMVKVIKAQALSDYFIHLGENPFTPGNDFCRVYAYDMSSTVYFRLSQYNEFGTGAGAYFIDSTYLFVLKYEFIAGTTNDEVSLFIFDTGIPGSEPVTPTIGPLTSGILDATDIGSIELRQGTASDAPRVIIDGIRIGDMWSDLIPPIPTLISPEDSAVINTQTPTFVWNAVVYGDSNNLVVDGPTKVGLDIYTLDTIYTPSISLDTGTYNWKVRAKDSTLGIWSDFSTPRIFTIDITPPAPPDSAIYPQNGSTINDTLPVFIWSGVAEADSYNIVVKTGVSWNPKQSLPTSVKDGGALAAVPGGKSDDKLYALRGYKSNLFYMYDDAGWTLKESLQFGLKPPDFVKFNKKFPGKGAALCYDGDNTIYATKGNGTWEFWAYTISDSTWTAKAFVPSVQKLKGGTSIAYKDGKVYLLAGAQKKDNYNNFFIYDPDSDYVGSTTAWQTLTGAPIIPPSTGKWKPFKDGSAISIIGNTIYAIKGGDKYNFFYAYDIDSNEWTEMESIPRVHPQLLKKNKVGDGGAMTNDGSELYIIKGKGKQEFWKYTPGAKGVWTPLEMTPFGPLNKNPKTGAALTYSDGSIWLLKGNKTSEFWQYGPSGAAGPKGVGVKIDEIIVDTTYATTTELGEGSYSWKVRSKDDADNWGEFSEEWNFEIDVIPEYVNPPTVTSTVVEKTSTTPDFNIDITPNPFTKLTTIRYTVPVSGKVSIKLYNATGRLIETLVNEYQNAGSYTLEIGNWKLEIPRGIYFLKYESITNKAEVKLIVQ